MGGSLVTRSEDADRTLAESEPVTMDDGETHVPCTAPSCSEDATNTCYDSNIGQYVAFCDDCFEEWVEKSHIETVDG